MIFLFLFGGICIHSLEGKTLSIRQNEDVSFEDVWKIVFLRKMQGHTGEPYIEDYIPVISSKTFVGAPGERIKVLLQA